MYPEPTTAMFLVTGFLSLRIGPLILNRRSHAEDAREATLSPDADKITTRTRRQLGSPVAGNSMR